MVSTCTSLLYKHHLFNIEFIADKNVYETINYYDFFDMSNKMLNLRKQLSVSLISICTSPI